MYMIAPESLKTFSILVTVLRASRGGVSDLATGPYCMGPMTLVAVASWQHTLALAPRAGYSGALQRPSMARSLKFHANSSFFFFSSYQKRGRSQNLKQSHFLGAMIGCLFGISWPIFVSSFLHGTASTSQSVPTIMAPGHQPHMHRRLFIFQTNIAQCANRIRNSRIEL